MNIKVAHFWHHEGIKLEEEINEFLENEVESLVNPIQYSTSMAVENEYETYLFGALVTYIPKKKG